MSSEELHELQEHAEEARHDKSLAPVSLTMAVLAVLVAVVSLLGHRAHTEEVVLQTKATDQWAFYQAKNIRRHNDELITDLAGIIPGTDPAALAKLRGKYSDEASRYKQDQNKIQEEAGTLDKEVNTETRRANRFDLGEVFLEIALVITSITLLSGRRIFWGLGLIMAAAGILVATTGFLIH